MVTLIGMGPGGPGSLTEEAVRALEGAELLIGARRLLSAVRISTAERIPEYRPEAVFDVIRPAPDRNICVIYSGDTGFYSGAAKLITLLEQKGIPFRVVPGLSSVQIFAARLGLPWQDWRLCSAHGISLDPVREVLKGGDVFFLTGGNTTPATLCRALADAGLGGLSAAVGEDLSYPGERIRRGTAAEFAGEHFAPLSVLLVRRAAPDCGKSDHKAAGCERAVHKTAADPGKGDKQRLMISAMGSGSGKTVLTCGLLEALTERGLSCEAFKCGPDYIDPMFHTRVLGVPSRNLDLFLQGYEGVRRSLASQRRRVALIEGAMGFYDGVSGTTDMSAWELAKTQRIPAVLAVKPSGSSVTLAAQLKGVLDFRAPSPVVGVILTACRPALYDHLRPILERETGLPVLGYLPSMEEAAIESRHLGLLTVEEVEDFKARFQAVGEQIEKTVDIDRLLSLAGGSENISKVAASDEKSEPDCTIAVARDEAFCFYYADSLDALERAGAKLVFFSPLRDKKLPPCEGLYLGGGYPELYAGELSENSSMRKSIAAAVRGGLPTVAECGGFLYLQEILESSDGISYPMAGVLPGRGFRTDRLQRFGYAYLAAETDSLLFRAGERIPVHEFHYWESTENGSDLAAEKPDGRKWRCGFTSPTLYAGFPHLSLSGSLPLAERLVMAARKEGSL